MLVKPYGLRILLVDRELRDTEKLCCALKQQPTDARTPCIVRNEEHLEKRAVGSGKSHRAPPRRATSR